MTREMQKKHNIDWIGNPFSEEKLMSSLHAEPARLRQICDLVTGVMRLKGVTLTTMVKDTVDVQNPAVVVEVVITTGVAMVIKKVALLIEAEVVNAHILEANPGLFPGIEAHRLA